jgi:EAL domain-containing protein (putative c-di-GMP-specific phosphodiesterase class I)
MNDSGIGRRPTAAELGSAIEYGGLVLHYQPIVDLYTGATVGAEALVRLEHPVGLIPPADFIHPAEEIGLIIPLGRWVIRTACEQAQAWQEQFGLDLSMTVNVSPRQLFDPDFVPNLVATLDATGFDPRRLVIDITEAMFRRDFATTREQLVALRALGIRVALDDFGTRSSLGHLHDFPIDSIKVDRSVIGAVGVDETKTALVRSIAAFALGLGLDTVAEGIETTQQRDVVTACGYRYGQGYLFAEPLTAAAFGQTLERIAAQPIS